MTVKNDALLAHHPAIRQRGKSYLKEVLQLAEPAFTVKLKEADKVTLRIEARGLDDKVWYDEQVELDLMRWSMLVTQTRTNVTEHLSLPTAVTLTPFDKYEPLEGAEAIKEKAHQRVTFVLGPKRGRWK